MTQAPRHPKSPADLSQCIARRWALAGLIGVTAGSTLIVGGVLDRLSPGLEALTSVATGWSAMLLCAPWKHLRTLRDHRAEIHRLSRQLRDVKSGRRRNTLSELVIDRNDELGALSRAIHDALEEVIAAQLESRLLQRNMGHNIRRETYRATRKLKREVMTDPLTGLGNRRALDQQLDELLQHERRSTGQVVAMVIDVDLFKSVNDTLGHVVGDQCLTFLADLLTSSMRREDRAIRLGGDEFLVLMPSQNLTEAGAAARRLSDLYAQMPWPHRDAPRPGLSIGLAAAWPGELAEPAELLRRADEATYASKRAGRGTVTIYDEIRGAA
ncbi:MAG: GGDEF domain-containing protein [Phycisphaerales bacterium]|nr:MAG: GGDEF domain-containing protein [Phycisphaerales bacterium]